MSAANHHRPLNAEPRTWVDVTGRTWLILAEHRTPAGKVWGFVVDPADPENVTFMERPEAAREGALT